MSIIARVCIIIVSVFFVSTVHAAGKHDVLSCTGCHGIHDAKGELIFAVAPNKKAVNPRNKKPFEGVTALCLGCHETTQRGGMGIIPVSAHLSHPFGVKPDPKVANVPESLLRDSKLECVGCHDPHPSNPNDKYLRVDTKGSGGMEKFCAVCHASKAGTKTANVKIFDSMDERKSSVQKTKSVKSPAKASKKK
jgi:predicted CXXCH cytochrome family protein